MTLWNETVSVVRGVEGRCRMNGKAFTAYYPPGSNAEIARLIDKHGEGLESVQGAIEELKEERRERDEIRSDPEEVRRLAGKYMVKVPVSQEPVRRRARNRKPYFPPKGEMIPLKEWCAREAIRCSVTPGAIRKRVSSNRYPGLKLKRISKRNILVIGV